MKNFRQQQHRPKKNTLIVGREAVLRAMEEGKQLDRIYLQSNVHGESVEAIKKTAAEHLVPINKVPVEKLNNFNVFNHEGCVAQISKVQYQDLQNIISLVVESGKAPLILILDGVTDIRNIGGIARSAFCFAVDAIVIPEKGVGALNEDALLTSAGALEQLAVCRVKNIPDAVEVLRLNGIRIFASMMGAKTKIADCNFVEPAAIIMGAEDKGIRADIVKMTDEQFAIPMPAAFDSLNVSVATGVILYEASRQRNG